MFKSLSKTRLNSQTGIVSDESGIAVVSIRFQGEDNIILKNCEFQPMSPDADAADETILNHRDVQKQTCSTLLNIGEYQLLVVDAPEVPPQELRAAVRWKIQDLIDFHIDDAVLDVFDAPPGGPAGTQKQMYVVVAHSATVKNRIEALEQNGVNLKVIDIPELAMRNLAMRLPEDQLGLVTLYFSKQQCLITLTHNATLFLTRTIDFQYSALHDESADPVEFSNRLALEIQRSLDYYEQYFHKAPIQTIAILPPPTNLNGLDNALQQTLGLTTRTLSLTDIVGCDHESDLESAASCLLAAGSALRTETRAL